MAKRGLDKEGFVLDWRVFVLGLVLFVAGLGMGLWARSATTQNAASMPSLSFPQQFMLAVLVAAGALWLHHASAAKAERSNQARQKEIDPDKKNVD